MKNYYYGTAEHPFHLSVGAVMINEEKEVACHYFKKFQSETDLEMVEDFYILMRETLEQGETLDQAVLRGIREEYGAKGEIVDYIGSIKSQFKRIETAVEKTTLYFLVAVKEYEPSLREVDDDERFSEIQWHPADFLIEKMKSQGRRYKRTDLDESVILERAKSMLA